MTLGIATERFLLIGNLWKIDATIAQDTASNSNNIAMASITN